MKVLYGVDVHKVVLLLLPVCCRLLLLRCYSWDPLLEGVVPRCHHPDTLKTVIDTKQLCLVQFDLRLELFDEL